MPRMFRLTRAEREKRAAKRERRSLARDHAPAQVENSPDVAVKVEQRQLTLCQSFEASVRGSYHPDRYFIEMNVDPTKNVATYIHEYWHYLQNISTLHGIKSFLVTQQLLARFTRTMKRDGTSEGDDSFSRDELDSLKFWSRWRSQYEGDRGPQDGEISAKVVAISGKSITFEALWLQRKKRKDIAFTLGAHAIKESVAHIVHRTVAQLTSEPLPNAPTFPYTVLELVASHLLPDGQVTPLAIAAIGTVSLLAQDPGLAIKSLLIDLSEDLQRGYPATEALVSTARRVVFPYFEEAARVVIDHDLPDLVRIHQGRVASAKAVEYLCEQKARGLQRRIDDPIFDIRCFFDEDPNSQISQLVALMRDAFIPCGMSFDGKVLTFHAPVQNEAELDLPQFQHAFQSQQEFMMMHLSSDRFRASSAVRCQCPFYSKCKHPDRVAREANCQTAPWRNYAESDTRCWFTLGVAATVGTGEVGKVLDASSAT